jgi:hypothetical protein
MSKTSNVPSSGGGNSLQRRIKKRLAKKARKLARMSQTGWQSRYARKQALRGSPSSARMGFMWWFAREEKKK